MHIHIFESSQLEGSYLGDLNVSATCAFLFVHVLGFSRSEFPARCYKVSVFDAIPPCIMASLSAKQGGGFALCLMPMHEEDVLGPGPVFPASNPVEARRISQMSPAQTIYLQNSELRKWLFFFKPLVLG